MPGLVALGVTGLMVLVAEVEEEEQLVGVVVMVGAGWLL